MPTPLEVIITVILHPLHYKYQNTILIKFYYTCYSNVPTIRMNPLITPLHFLSYSLYLTPFILLLYLTPLSYPLILPLYLTPLSYPIILLPYHPFILPLYLTPFILPHLSYSLILSLYLTPLSYQLILSFILYIYLTPLSYPLILLPLYCFHSYVTPGKRYSIENFHSFAATNMTTLSSSSELTKSRLSHDSSYGIS